MLNFLTTTALAAAAAMAASLASAQVNLTAETGVPGTVSYLAPSTLVELASAAGVANIQLKDGQTLTNSILNVAEGKTNISSAPFIIPFLMSRGVGPYGNLGAEKGAELAANIRVLYPYTFGVFFLYAYDAKNVGGWDDLEGRKILNGPPRGGATGNSRTLIQLITGLKSDEGYESVTVNWGQAVTTVTDGSVDAALIPELFPSGRPTQMSAAGAMTAFSIPKEAFESEAMQKYFAAPGNAAWEMPVSAAQNIGRNWTIVSEDDTFRGMATAGGEITNADLDEDLAYQLVKLHIDNLDLLKAKAPYASYARFGEIDETLSGMCGVNPLKYHAGAVRAWEEAGFTIPDCAKP